MEPREDRGTLKGGLGGRERALPAHSGAPHHDYLHVAPPREAPRAVVAGGDAPISSAPLARTAPFSELRPRFHQEHA